MADEQQQWTAENKRPRPRKSISKDNNNKTIIKVEALVDSSILTLKAWEVVVDLFQSHFATMLPFLHPASFLNQIREFAASSSSSDNNNKKAKSEPSPLLLLGVLALTARHHPQLVAHHSPAANHPLVASEFYARALRARLTGTDGLSLTRVQAFLMLALHEWSMDRGMSAWIYVGAAIRLAQAMGLEYELEIERTIGETSDDVIAHEVKRRTFWASFVLDRCLSPGGYRPRTVHVKNLRIQLPSDNAFAFGERVRTSRLNVEASHRPPWSLRWEGQRKGSEDDDVIDRWEIGAEESVLSRVIRVVRIWGSIVKWSCAGVKR